MEVVHYTGQRPSRYAKIALSFGTEGLVTSAIPNGGTEAGDLLEVKLETVTNQPPELRQFTVSSVEIFCRAQAEFKKSYPEPVSQKLVTGFSVAYRGAILDLLESFQKTEATADLAMLYSHLDCVWHFCEIMFLSSNPDLPILPYYMDWIKVNFDDSNSNLLRIIPELPELSEDSLDLLWSIIYKHTYHGRTKDAAKLLEFVNREQSQSLAEQLGLMAELMQKKPTFQPAQSPISEFNVNWQLWREECEHRLGELAFCGSPQLTLLCKVLAGRDDGFQEMSHYISSWYEYLCMMLNYQFPLLRPSSLKSYAYKGIDDYGEFSIVLSPLDKILLAAMDYDAVSVLRDMQSQWNHPWFPLHFADLIFTGGVYSSVADSRIDYNSVGPIRHDLVREYGIQMLQHPTLWEIGVKYLEAIPHHLGLPVIAEVIQRKKPGSEFEAEKLIHIAEKFDFKAESEGICRCMALRKYQKGEMQNALLWAIRAKDPQLTATVVDRILQEGEVDIAPSLVDFIPKFSACGDRLLFLNGFCEFTKLVQSRRLKEAVELLCQLIEQNLIPKTIRAKILISFHEIMRKNEVKLEPAEVSILMQFLHTKVDRTNLPSQVFLELNQILLGNRATEMLNQFQLGKKLTRPTKV